MAPKKTPKAQSAMEYLMTYGWAIIIILVVLAVLYILNVFNPSELLGSTCGANSKYQCAAPVLLSNGTLSFHFGQVTGTTEYNLAFACGQATNITSGEPLAKGTSPWMYANDSGVVFASLPYPSSGTPPLALDSGSQAFITGLICYDLNGNIFANAANYLNRQRFELLAGKESLSGVVNRPAVGTPFSGSLWVEYTNNPGPVNNAINPYVITPFATLSTSVATASTTTVV